MLVIRDDLLHFGVGLVDVLRVTGQGNPAERSDAAAEQRTDIGRDEAGEVEGVTHAHLFRHLANVVAVVKGRNAHLAEGQHRGDVFRHGAFRGKHRAFRVGLRFLLIVFPRPAFWQVAVQRVMGAGLVGDQIRAHAAGNEFRKNVRRVAAQGNRHRFAFGRVFFDARQRVIEILGLFVDVTGTQTEINAALLALNVQRARAGQRGGQRLRAAHPAKTGGQYPAAFQRAVVVLATGLHEGLIGALHDPLTADVDPAARGHLAIHRQPFRVEFVEVFPGGPVRHEVRVGDQHARGIFVGFKHANRLAGLHQQGFVVFEFGQCLNNGVIAFPVARGAANAAVDHQLVGVFRHLRIKVVHQHAQRGFGEPAFGGKGGAARGADVLLAVFT